MIIIPVVIYLCSSCSIWRGSISSPRWKGGGGRLVLDVARRGDFQGGEGPPSTSVKTGAKGRGVALGGDVIGGRVDGVGYVPWPVFGFSVVSRVGHAGDLVKLRYGTAGFGQATISTGDR